MDLLSWMSLNKTNVGRCARAWQMHYSTVHAIAHRTMAASYVVGVQIERHTGGACTLRELCEPIAKPQPGAALVPKAITAPRVTRARAAPTTPAPRRGRPPKVVSA